VRNSLPAQIAKIAKPTVATSGSGTPESGKIRLVESKKNSERKKAKIAMLCERSLLKGDEGGAKFGRGWRYE
jgi:hypothetical protein